MPTSRFSALSKGKSGCQGGHTLIEVLVVIAIISILSAILLGYSRQSGQRIALVTASAKLESLISRAKFLSMQSYFDSTLEDNVQVCAYGIRADADNNSVNIFRVSREGVLCPRTSTDTCDADAGEPEKCERGEDGRENTVEHLEGEFSKVELKESLSMSGTLKSVVFVPPDPVVILNGDPSVTSKRIEIIQGEEEIRIFININGKIEIE